MKTKIAILGLLLGSWTDGRCDLLLNAGESFVYQFQTIPFDFNVLPPQWLTVNAHFGYAFDPSTFDMQSDVVRIEAFETSTNEAPFFSGLAPYAGYGWALTSGFWQDLQGVLRITVDSGSVALQSIQIGVVTPRAGGGYSAYNSPNMPVPQPSLRIERTSIGVNVSWPAQNTNWILEWTGTMGATNQWDAITKTATLVGTEWMVTDTTVESRRFYRLRKP